MMSKSAANAWKEHFGNDQFWFFQDRISDEITSVSCGQVWIFFYKSALIGVVDYDSEPNEDSPWGWWLDLKSLPKIPNYFSHYHEIEARHIKEAMVDKRMNISTEVRTLPPHELQRKAIDLCIESFGREIDRKFTTY